MTPLDQLGICAGTDKSRLVHDYLRQYERLFRPFVDSVISVLEIGIHNGASLAIWERFFSNATIVGVDIAPSTRRFARGRVYVEIGSQVDPEFLAEIAQRYKPSIVIDDGSHLAEDQIFSFEQLFPRLQPGGIYVVEDIHGFSEPTLAADHFLRLQRACLLRRPPRGVAAIEVIPGAVIVHKTACDELDGDFCALEMLADESELSETMLHLSRYMETHGAPKEEVLRVTRRACALDPNNPWAHFALSKVLASLGQMTQASAAVRHAIAISPAPHQRYFDHLNRLEHRLGQA